MGISNLSSELIRRPCPKEDDLAAKAKELARLANQLASCELELTDLERTLRLFEHRYFQAVGPKYVELDRLIASIAEKKARNRPHDSEAAYYAHKARIQSEKSAREYSYYAAREDLSEKKESVPKKLKKLYRKIAAQIHPDKAEDEESRKLRTRLMAELNEAYSMGDEAAMGQIQKEWLSSPEAVTGKSIEADLERLNRTIAKIKRKILKIKRETERLKHSEIYLLMIRIQEAKAKGRDLLNELVQDLDEQIRQAKKILDGLR